MTELKILGFWIFNTSMSNTHEQLARKFVKYVALMHVCWVGDKIIYSCERIYPNVPESAKCKTSHGPLVAPGLLLRFHMSA
jgi:hypothetical protein